MEKKRKISIGDKRFYLDFTCTVDMGKNVVKGYSTGCNLSCLYCWSMTRDYWAGETRFIPPRGYGLLQEIQGYYSPKEVLDIINQVAQMRYRSVIGQYEEAPREGEEINWYEIAGCEPCLTMSHILGLLEVFKDNGWNLLILTNGVILGKRKDFCENLLKYKEIIFINIGIKAGTEQGFTQRTRGILPYFPLPFLAISNLVALGFQNFTVSIMSDKRIMSDEEKEICIKRIREAGYKGEIFHETYFPHYAATYRVRESKLLQELYNLSWQGVYRK